MKATKLNLWYLVAVVAAFLLGACSPDTDDTLDTPSVEMELVAAGAYDASFRITTSNATHGAWLCVPHSQPFPSTEEILAEGNPINIDNAEQIYKAEWLVPESGYTIVAAVAKGQSSSSSQLTFTTTAATAPTESHALIVVMQGDNGLADFMDTNLQNIISAYYKLPEGSQIVIFYDRGNYTRLTELYMSDGMVKQRLLKEYNRTLSSVDPDFLAGVFELIEAEVEADSYGMILSSHGGGWVPGDIYTSYLRHDWSASGAFAEPAVLAQDHTTTTKFFGQDGSEYMDITTLSEVISTFYYDYIIFDACFMSSVEGLYDLRDNTDYIIASSAEVLGNGFPYPEMIPMLFRPDHGLKLTCEAYMELFESSSGTISLIDCSAFDQLAEAMRRVVAVADDTIDYAQIQGYEGYPIHLYYDLEQHVEQLTDDEALREEFRTALNNTVIFTDHTPTYFSALCGEQTLPLPRSCGLTCHVEREEFPATHAAYLQTSWAKFIGAQ